MKRYKRSYNHEDMIYNLYDDDYFDDYNEGFLNPDDYISFNYSYLDIRLDGFFRPSYSIIDLDSVYSKEKLRDKKIDSILEISDKRNIIENIIKSKSKLFSGWV